MPFDKQAYQKEYQKKWWAEHSDYRRKKWAEEKNQDWYKEYMQTDKYKESKLRTRLKRRYGLTLEEYNSMYDSQKGICAICKNPPSINDKLCVDHNEDTLRIRMLLCRQCNVGLGNFKHSPELLQKAAAYLELFKE